MARTDPESAPPASSGVSCSMESMRRRTEPPRMITSRFSGGVGARRSGMKTPPAWRNDDGTCSAFPASKQQAQATRNATTIGDFSANGSSRGRICVLSLSFFLSALFIKRSRQSGWPGALIRPRRIGWEWRRTTRQTRAGWGGVESVPACRRRTGTRGAAPDTGPRCWSSIASAET